jgi:hypothetical protein
MEETKITLQEYLSYRRNEYFTNTCLRNEIGKCELCDALYRVYKYCGKNQIHEFKMKDIRDLLGRNEYARFGDLVRFGGLVYKPEHVKASFGINMSRAKEFFYGLREIPIWIRINQLTGEIIDSKYVKIGDFPELKDLLTKDGLYKPEEKMVIGNQSTIFDHINEAKFQHGTN